MNHYSEGENDKYIRWFLICFAIFGVVGAFMPLFLEGFFK